MRSARRERDERGAVAVMAAVLAVVMFAVCALAVDLGSAFFRDREAQKQVDVATLSAAAKLPMDSGNHATIVADVALQLNALPNELRGQAEVTVAQLQDGNEANGEVTFPDDNTLKVIAPPATVDNTFAQIMDDDFDTTTVQREATVQIRTPIPAIESVLPMWLTAGCMYGQVEGDTDTHAAPSVSPKYTLNSPRGNHETGTLVPATVVFGTTPVTVQVPITNIPTGRTSAVVRFTFGNTQIVDYPVTFPVTTSASRDRTVSVVLDEEASSTDNDITSVPGTWEVWPMMGTDYPKNNRQGTFLVTGGGEIGCSASERGNFGQLDSPRKDESRLQFAYAKNVANGLDHELAQFVNAPTYECTADNNPAGALIDNNPNRDGSNCLYAQPGNDPNGLTNGLLTGGSDYSGRLQKPNSPGCSGPAGAPSGRNNDVLSCFLKPGYTLDDVARDNPPLDAFDVSIFNSPRFFYVPVVWFDTRAEKKFLAIKTFAPVFLTDETRAASKGASDATSKNGIQTNPAGKVQQVSMFAFSPLALPVKPNAETVDYDGTRGVLRLIN